MMIRFPGLIVAMLAWAVLAWWSTTTYGQSVAQSQQPITVHPAIRYGSLPLTDPVSHLAKQIDNGEVKLVFRPGGAGYLPDLLRNLGVNVDSQVLIFSKTSFQSSRISPSAPRAIFFNDTVSVGSVQNGDVLELAALDPKQGVIFYSLDVHETEKPKFVRRGECLQCHQDASNLYVPGLLVESVYPAADGTSLLGAGNLITDHRTPIEDRWGGWYVTGLHGSQHHLGNAVALDVDRPTELQPAETQNLTNLRRKFDSTNYLAETSDIVALLTLEHQTRMTNLITRVGWQTRIALSEGGVGGPADRRLDEAVDQMVNYMLFADESPLLEGVKGVSTFTKTFPERGLRDGLGRSLRDFDLQKRLFRYPLSYMIYSDAFDALPGAALDKIYRRLYDVLTDKDSNGAFAQLPVSDRRAALEILRATKPELPAYFRNDPK